MLIYLLLAPSLEMIHYYEYLDSLFSNVSKSEGVDKELLKSIAYVQTRFYHHKCPSIDSSIGIMGVKDFSIPINYNKSIEVECENCLNKKITLNGIKAYLVENEENNIRYASKLLRKFLNECSNT